MSNANSNWSQETLIAAIHQLRIQYIQQAEACIALLIARYCNLLVKQLNSDTEKQLWQNQADHWASCYQINRQLNSSLR